MNRFYYFNTSFDLVIGGFDVKPYQKVIDEMNLLALTLGTSNDIVISNLELPEDYYSYLKSLSLEKCKISNKHISEYKDYCPVVWGWDKHTYDIFNKNGFEFKAPTHESTSKVNTKVFSNRLAEKYEQPHGKICCSVGELYSAVSEIKKIPFVIKPEYGSAGVGFIIKREQDFSKQEINKIEKYFSDTGNSLIVECWRKKHRDYSLSFEISQDGKVGNYTINRQSINTRGIFNAVTLDYSDKVLEKNRELINQVFRRTADALFETGYFGSVGIDMYSYYDDQGNIKLNPLCEINARRTMVFIPQELMKKYPAVKKCMFLSLSRKELKKLIDYQAVAERLNGLHFDKIKGKGIVILLPLYYMLNNSLAKNSRNFLFIAADSNKELEWYYQQFKERIS